MKDFQIDTSKGFVGGTIVPDPVQRLRDAISQPGNHPNYHKRIMATHRREWPTLWKAIDELLNTSPNNSRQVDFKLQTLIDKYRDALLFAERNPHIKCEAPSGARLDIYEYFAEQKSITPRLGRKLTKIQKDLDIATRAWASERGQGQGDWEIPEELQKIRVRNGLFRIEWNNRLSKLIEEPHGRDD